MLTQEENRMLTGVSAGTPLHRPLSRYWYPVMRGSRLLDRCTHKVRLLGEDFVVARRGAALLAIEERLEDWIGEDYLVRVVDLFVDELDLVALGFERCAPARTGRPRPRRLARTVGPDLPENGLKLHVVHPYHSRPQMSRRSSLLAARQSDSILRDKANMQLVTKKPFASR